ncbi:MAG: hypothetical protein WA393_13180 [Nitrososphaeraceae archaeon]
MVQTGYPITFFDIYHNQIRINYYEAGTTLALQRGIKELNNTTGV